MFVSGTIITQSTSKSRRIDDLETGDEITDPISGRVGRLIAVHKRDVAFGVSGIKIFSELRPVRIAKGAITGAHPKTDILVSPGQSLLYLAKRGAKDIARLGLVSAQSLVDGAGFSRATDVKTCRYFALFFETPQLVEAQGGLFYCAPGPYLQSRASLRTQIMGMTAYAGRLSS